MSESQPVSQCEQSTQGGTASCKLKNAWGSVKNLLFAEKRPWLRTIISALMHYISLVGLDFGFRFIYRKDDPHLVSILTPTLLTLFWCLIIVSVALFLPRVAKRIYIIASTTVFGILACVHGIFDSFFGQYMSFSSILFAGEGAEYFDASYFSIPKKFIALILLCIFIAIISALILPKTRYNWICLVVSAALLAGGITGVILCKNNFFKEEDGFVGWASTKTVSDYYDEFADYHVNMHLCGLYHYTFRDFSISTGLSDILIRYNGRYGELDDYYEAKELDPDNEMTGIFKDKNLILIQLESIDTWMVNDISMPTLAGLREQSINFPNFYAPKYLVASTFNSENIVNTGTISPTNSSKLSYFIKTEYPESMPNLFKEQGYTVNSFHRSNDKTYSRGDAHVNWGYEDYCSGGDMKLTNYDLDSYLMEAYDMFAPDEKFMSFIITYTGHGPYKPENEPVKLYEDIIRPKLPEDAEDEYVYALCHAYETDMFIKALTERLEAEDRMDDTVLIFYTDHYDHYVTDERIFEKYKGTTNPDLMSNVPFFIYSKGTEARTIDKVVATFDILPTVVNLFDLNSDGRYYLGNDAFSQNGGYVFFTSGSWIDKDQYFDISSSEATDFSKERAKEISTRFKISWDSVKLDYFKDKHK